MDDLTATWVHAAKSALKSLQENYRSNKALILTEGDFECHLFSELLKQERISGFHEAADPGYKTTYVHSQVTWFKPQQLSGFKVDITICDPRKLQVKNLELFEDYPHKGFAYDGECVAIEIKFIRHTGDASMQAHEDLLKFRDELIPAKLKNIEELRYRKSNQNNIAFISIVGCKDKETFERAKYYIGKHLSDERKPFYQNLFVWVFYQNEIVFDNEDLKETYKSYLKTGKIL